MFSFFRKRTPQQQHFDPTRLSKEQLAELLFENAMLHIRNIALRFRDEHHIDEEQHDFISQLLEYSLAIIIFYIHASDRLELKDAVVQAYENYVTACQGPDADPQETLMLWRRVIQTRLHWLSMGNNSKKPDINAFVRNILSDRGFPSNISGCQMDSYVEQFIRELDSLVKRLGIIT
jgi:hypothetical protein